VYNVSCWKTKRLEDFCIPVSAFYAAIPKGTFVRGLCSFPIIEDVRDCMVICIEAPGFRMCGKLYEDEDDEYSLRVEEVEITAYGWDNGPTLDDVILPAFEESSGLLQAMLIWNGGDSIERLTVRDGRIMRDEVEL